MKAKELISHYPAIAVGPKQENFIRSIGPAAILSSVLTGIPASLVIAQAILESGWGSSTLSTECRNYFGIKKGDWTGKVKAYVTHEYYDPSTPTTIVDEFRCYDNGLQSVHDHAKLLIDKPRYNWMLQYPRTDYRSWTTGIKQSGYATSPTYTQKLNNLIETYQLNTFDKVAEQIANSSSLRRRALWLSKASPRSKAISIGAASTVAIAGVFLMIKLRDNER